MDDRWERWVRRSRQIVFPAFGVGLVVVLRDADPAPVWLVPIILALIFDPGAGAIDRAWRDRKNTDG